MSTIEERAKHVQTRLVDLGRKQAGQQLVQRLTETTTRSARSVQQLDAAARLASALRADEVPVPPLDKKATESAQKARTQLRTTATKLEAAELADQEALRILDGIALQGALKAGEELTQRRAALLSRVLQSEQSNLVPESIHDPIPEVPGQAAKVVRLERHRRTLTATVDVSVSDLNAEGLERILDGRRRRVEAAREWITLYPEVVKALDDEPPEVRTFLQAAASPGGAALSLLTAGVKSRLDAQDMLDEFRIHRKQ